MNKKKKTLLTIFKIFSMVLVSVLIGYNLYIINARVVLKEKLPMP
jgi:hypothetical protein